MYKRIFVGLLLTLSYSTGFGQTKANVKKIEKLVAAVVKKVMGATVKIAAFDTLSQTLAVSQFSGVVVNEEGLVLTAAHATQPKQIYQLCFPNGRKILAKGLGRISLGKDKPATDVAMMQIIENGIWPFAEMAYSSEMIVGQPCIGISFPGTFEQKLPNVRLGRIETTDISKGNFQSSCKMEPGDSGGALFDVNGRLIGIHSWILNNEQQNFEVPIDLYRRYWDALHVPISYDSLPKSINNVATSCKIDSDTIPPLDLMAIIKTKNASSVINISSTVYDHVMYFSLGTILKFEINGKPFQGILTKSSSVGDQALITFRGKQFKAKTFYRNKENDLALLRIDNMLPSGIDLSLGAAEISIPLGTVLFSALADGKSKVGIASTHEIEMEMKYSFGFLGAKTKFINDQVTITEIPKGYPADGILKTFDRIKSINGIAINRPEQYIEVLSKYYQNDTISMEIFRDGKAMLQKIRLGIFRPVGHTGDSYSGGRSPRSDGFKKVIAQDAAIKANECGGPVFDVAGHFVGINIGRHSRTSTIIMPADVIAKFCEQYVKELPLLSAGKISNR
ncbi:trypsin-like peptidase domain-containing protein [Pedobacter sp. P26]|uniref:trypsin-like peptidase domain-containing protein n=1 Tax=Pedobacter sp. P26 TaxID=3423956 RepID=UPI003D67F5EA